MRIIAGNWKMNKNPAQAREFFSSFKEGALAAGQGSATQGFGPKGQAANAQTCLPVIFAASICLEAVATSTQAGPWQWGAQNSYFQDKGAFTGETSAQVVKDLGGQWILLGHSERRALFAESDELIAKKVTYVQSLSLTPMLCVGETLDERQGGQTQSRLRQQLQINLQNADRQKPLAIAYEPVWAIGTGKVATPEMIEEAHQFILKTVQEFGFASTQIPVLYGGSVTADNVAQILPLPSVRGFLIGGASLEPASFAKIYQASCVV